MSSTPRSYISFTSASNFGHCARGVTVLLGDGTGGFARALGIPFSLPGDAQLVVDFNSDGKADLAFADHGGAKVIVLLGDGNGGFGRALVSFLNGQGDVVFGAHLPGPQKLSP